ncbi:MFS transporter [Bacillus sp. FJAT-45037]|uniref:MFS transporter n=1 Tax=Bacillus sp. FJAT-45037 TaxID=2011007 RepID=UPI000C236EBE|nr:MFS transporter [Bacillus sp. FJAT-45037]
MTSAIDVFIEYRIHEKFVNQYEETMLKLEQALTQVGAYNFKWYIARDQPHLYVEMFKVSEYSQYELIKKMRQDQTAPINEDLHEYIDGGAEKVNCWAFLERTNKEDNRAT